MNWRLDGLRLYRERGLDIPPDVQAAVAEYRSESDSVGEFLAAETEEAPGAEIKAHAFYADYRAWADSVSVHAVSRTLFGRRLGDKGIKKTKNRKGAYYHGLTVKQSVLDRREAASPPPDAAPSPASPDDYGIY